MPSNLISLMIFVGYLVLTILVGLWQARQIRSARDYSVSKMSVWRAAAFLTGFTMGGGATYGIAGDTVKFGMTYLIWFPLSVTLGWILTGILFARKYYSLGGITLPTLLARRFDSRTRLATSLSTMLYAFFTILMEIYALAVVILSLMPTITLAQASIISLIVCVGSVAFSGMLGSSKANLMHSSVVFVAFSLTLFILWRTVGGIGVAMDRVITNLPAIAAPGVDQRIWLSISGMGWGVVGQLLFGKAGRLGGISVVSNLAASCKSEKDALKAFIFAGLLSGITPLLAGLVGVFTAASLGSQVSNLPTYSSIGLAVIRLSPVLAGFLLAAVAAGILSTFGPVAIVFSHVLIDDILKQVFRLTDRTERFIYPISIILISILSTAYVATKGIKDLLPFIYSTAFPCTVPPTIVALFGLYTEKVDRKAAFWAITLGVPLALIWGLVLDEPFNIPNIYIALIVSSVILTVNYLWNSWASKRQLIAEDVQPALEEKAI